MRRFGRFDASEVRGIPSLSWRTAEASDCSFVFQLAEQYRYQMGFFPYDTFPKVISEGRCCIAVHDGERIGYFLTSAGMYKPATLRQSCIQPEYRDRGFGTAQACAALLWAFQMTAFEVMYIRTRTDIERQLKINATLGGVLLDQARNPHTRGDNRIHVFEVNLSRFASRHADGVFDRLGCF